MKKITDEIMAKALGWKKHKHRDGYYAWWPSSYRGNEDLIDLPHFTTSLDAIVGEIEARGLWWIMTRETAKGWALASLGEFLKSPHDHKADTPALALCHALLSYLKSTPSPKRKI